MRLLVTGAGGMLGADVASAAERAGHEPLLFSHSELDITDAAGVRALLGSQRPDGVINCAAWTDVDAAEEHSEQAHAVNAAGAGNLARSAAEIGAPLVHVSTDYVFDGHAPLDQRGNPRAYLESDQTGPRSIYGQSKLAGEQLVLAASARHTVARSAWLFGVHGRNFAETMLRAAAQRPAVQVVDDQIGCPTWTGHLGPALIGLLSREVSGMVHLAGSGRVSWHGFAREIFRQAELACEVQAMSTAQLARAAPRPAWSALETERHDVLPLPPWQDGLAGYLACRAGMIRA